MQYATFPMPDNYPNYLGHKMIAKYFDDFVDNFGFRERIQFRTEVTRADPVPGGAGTSRSGSGIRGRGAPSATMLCWSPTATTGIHGIRNRPFRALALPKPDHQMLCAPPTVSDSLLSRLDHGDIVVKPAPRILQPATTSSQA